MDIFETVTVIAIGIGLSAACGFRIFIPLLIVSVASKAEMLSLSSGFEWLGSWPAVAALAIATVLEIGAYYLPVLDNLLDSVATPAAVVAGVLASAACIADMDPLLQWSVAIIAGGGVAGVVQTGSVGIRTASTTTTGGIGNPIVSTLEWIASVVLSALAIIAPIAAAIVVAILLVIMIGVGWRFMKSLSARKKELSAGA